MEAPLSTRTRAAAATLTRWRPMRRAWKGWTPSPCPAAAAPTTSWCACRKRPAAAAAAAVVAAAAAAAAAAARRRRRRLIADGRGRWGGLLPRRGARRPDTRTPLSPSHTCSHMGPPPARPPFPNRHSTIAAAAAETTAAHSASLLCSAPLETSIKSTLTL
ncbi:MAG: hypothetical protein J3K34DRAFT_87400 [Monoraphidium minutum]|nr:MAG: hypothetical protein J3K34DRAFT_87400 [Monoraphidium minutum]